MSFRRCPHKSCHAILHEKKEREQQMYMTATSDNELWFVCTCTDTSYRRSGNFRCENIFVVCTNHENKHKYILQQIIIIVRIFLFAHFHSTASYFAQDGLFNTRISLKLMPNVKQLFAQCPRNRLSLLPQYAPTALLGSLLHATSPPTAAWYPRTQHASCAYT